MRRPPKEGMRVLVKSLNIRGTIFHVDRADLFTECLYPVQVELDKPYDESDHRMIRTDLKDIQKLIKRRKR